MDTSHLPDFIIAGAPRSGTTWLCHLLELAPEIFMAQPLRPEPKFFLVDDIYAKGIDDYSRTWFSTAKPGAIKGEKSANYLESAVAACRMAKHLPNVKLIFMLREPASRAYSNYLWSRMNGMETEDFRTALSLEAERDKNTPQDRRYSRPHAYFSRGLYADHLGPYFEKFERSRILCLRYEDIGEKPDFLTKQINHFLGLQIPPDSFRSLGKVNAVPPAQEPPPEKSLQKLRGLYAAPNEKLAALLRGAFEIWEEKEYA